MAAAEMINMIFALRCFEMPWRSPLKAAPNEWIMDCAISKKNPPNFGGFNVLEGVYFNSLFNFFDIMTEFLIRFNQVVYSLTSMYNCTVVPASEEHSDVFQ